MKEKFNLTKNQLLVLIDLKRHLELIIPKSWQNRLIDIAITLNQAINHNDRSYLPVIARSLCHTAAKCDLGSDLFHFLKEKKDELVSTINFKNNFNYYWI